MIATTEPQPQSKLKLTKKYEHSLDTIKYLSVPQLNALLAAARKHSVRDYTILLTAYSHAMRISEVGRLQVQDYNPETRRLKMRRVKKGHSPSYLTSDDVAKALTQWLKIRGSLSGPLFVSRRSKLGTSALGTTLPKGISKRTLHDMFYKYATEANLPEDLKHFHTLRHSCAVHMVDRGIPIVQIQDWLGHKNIASTSVYARVSDVKRDETAGAFYGSRNSGNSDGVQWKKDKR